MSKRRCGSDGLPDVKGLDRPGEEEARFEATLDRVHAASVGDHPSPWRGVRRSGSRVQRPRAGSKRSTSRIVPDCSSPPTTTILPRRGGADAAAGLLHVRQLLPAPRRRPVTLGDLEVASPGRAPGEHRTRPRRPHRPGAHARCPCRGRASTGGWRSRRSPGCAVPRRSSWRRRPHRASSPYAHRQRGSAGRRVGQPRPPVAPGVVAVQRGDLATQVAAARVPAQHVDVPR